MRRIYSRIWRRCRERLMLRGLVLGGDVALRGGMREGEPRVAKGVREV
jgi:hypothetical protein